MNLFPFKGKKVAFVLKNSFFLLTMWLKRRKSTKKWLTLRREKFAFALGRCPMSRPLLQRVSCTSPPPKAALFSISATYSPPMEVNPCKKCGRPVSVHAEYCPYCGCVVDRRPFVPASTSKPLGGGSTPAPSAPVSRPVAPPPPATPSPTPAPTAAATPSPELQAVERLSEELGVATAETATSTAHAAAAQSSAPASSTTSAAVEPVAPTVAPEVPPVPPTPTPPVAPPPAFEPSTDEDDDEPRRSGGGMKWALGLLALVVGGCAAGGYYYYDRYLAAPEPTVQTPIAKPDTTPAAPAAVADNEAELREKVVNYWDVYAKRSSGLILQYTNAQLRKMLEAKGFVNMTDTTATASTAGDEVSERADVYELTTTKGAVLCRFVINNGRVYNELWFKYPEDKAAFVKAAAGSGFKAGTSVDREAKTPTFYSSFTTDSVRTYPNTRHDYIVAGEETLKLFRERER